MRDQTGSMVSLTEAIEEYLETYGPPQAPRWLRARITARRIG